jgi:hypothetical protein
MPRVKLFAPRWMNWDCHSIGENGIANVGDIVTRFGTSDRPMFW